MTRIMVTTGTNDQHNGQNYAPLAQWIEHRPSKPGCREFESLMGCQDIRWRV